MNPNAPSTSARRRFLPRLALVGLLLAALTACSTTRQSRQSETDFSGFLGDYSQLKPGTGDQANFVYIDSNANWSQYTKVYIKSVELWTAPGSDSKLGSLDPNDQQMLINYLHTSLANTLGKDFAITNSPGPGVLVLRAAISDAGKAKPVMNITSSILPVGIAASYAKQAVTGTGSGVGAVMVEAELTDGQTGRRLAAAVDARSGTKALRSKFDGSWGDVKAAFDWWSQRLSLRLAELKSGARNTEPL